MASKTRIEGLEPSLTSYLRRKRKEAGMASGPHTERQAREWLSAAECAARLGLTPRGLRLYESVGLIRPRRTEKNWRLYGREEVARLHEVIALKRLGLRLKSITALLKGKPVDLERTLAMQAAALSDQRRRAERSLLVIEKARARIASGEALALSDLISIAKGTDMTSIDTETTAWKRYEQARPRTEIALDPTLLTPLLGAYRLESSDIIRIAAREGGLSLRLASQPTCDLYAEAENRFFLRVAPAQIVFDRAGSGPAPRLELHQGGFEFTAIRISESEAEATEERQRERKRLGRAFAGGDDLLRQLIAKYREGIVDEALLDAPLAALGREQMPIIRSQLAALGLLTGLRFRGVGDDDYDVYEAAFENGAVELRISLNTAGKADGLLMRPLP
jgi:DNA-binding transcriptional MerR regulator